MFDILSLRNNIESWFSQDLGTYTFEGTGITPPAIAVLPDKIHGYKYPPSGVVSVQGLEIIIAKNLPAIAQRINNDLKKSYRVDIQFRQWNKLSTNKPLIEIVETFIDYAQEEKYRLTSPIFLSPDQDPNQLGYASISLYQDEIRTL